MVAILRDDETLTEFAPGPTFRIDAQWVGGGLYLLAVPAADRQLLGTRLLAVDGQPIAQVLATTGTVIGGEDEQLRSDSETGALDDGSLLQWLGISPAPAAESLTVETAGGSREEWSTSSPTPRPRRTRSPSKAGAVPVGQPPADPLDTWGNEQTFQLPWSKTVIQYTTLATNPGQTALGIPDLVVEPTLAQILRGDDPVLAAAISDRPPGRAGPRAGSAPG